MSLALDLSLTSAFIHWAVNYLGGELNRRACDAINPD
jgi:hypothetical protein